MSIPKVFISYSHDTQDHKKWILELAYRLRNNGIDAILDQFELKPGDDLPHFMETNLASSDYIIMVCSEKYVEKANSGTGGVGYEKMIITSNLMKQIDVKKIIPIIKQTGGTDLPTFLKSKLYINFSKSDEYEYCYDELVRTIHQSPLFEKPEIGNNPFTKINEEKLEGDLELLNAILKQIMLHYEAGEDFFEVVDLTQELKISRTLTAIKIARLKELGYIKWYAKGNSVLLTTKGKQYLLDNKI
ncbi:toll/interleukin-1 receptor domain-containing protein [Mucilaginibacter ginsenosidivorax]|uniref:toll/interleukin-1 receptor domain-containing protein n=1 Tax=Mucilaginibacter ginsenosidivorax TaxID=862126 RepID=UPI0018645EBA|nr:toll/interleukin-1 receptor domain-containing protein [Mucilaginibacter ginsenosidivorax]